MWKKVLASASLLSCVFAGTKIEMTPCARDGNSIEADGSGCQGGIVAPTASLLQKQASEAERTQLISMFGGEHANWIGSGSGFGNWIGSGSGFGTGFGSGFGGGDFMGCDYSAFGICLNICSTVIASFANAFGNNAQLEVMCNAKTSFESASSTCVTCMTNAKCSTAMCTEMFAGMLGPEMEQACATAAIFKGCDSAEFVNTVEASCGAMDAAADDCAEGLKMHCCMQELKKTLPEGCDRAFEHTIERIKQNNKYYYCGEPKCGSSSFR